MITYNNLISSKYEILLPLLFSKWIIQVIEKEGYILGDITYIFGHDLYINKINRKFLQRNTLTDVISFYESENEDIISGEIFISLDRIVENAKIFHISPTRELSRVLLHGVLHLMGYEDGTDKEKKMMRGKEDYYINLQSSKFKNLFHVKHL